MKVEVTEEHRQQAREWIAKQPKVGVTIRAGRKVVKSATITLTYAKNLVVEAHKYNVTKAMLLIPTLKRGDKFKYKHAGMNVTIEPLHEHIDNY